MKDLSEKIYREIQNTSFMFKNIFFPHNLAGFEIMWKNMVEQTDHR
jgi:hypothetical protein